MSSSKAKEGKEEITLFELILKYKNAVCKGGGKEALDGREEDWKNILKYFIVSYW